MASFNGKAFEKKLKEMDASQTSIQTVSLWIIHHRQVGKQVVNSWSNFMKKSKPERRLLLLYLANDVIQNGRKKAKELIPLFGKAVKECMQLFGDPKIKQSVERVLNIWEERKIYDKDFVGKLKIVLDGNKKPKVSKTIPADYKLSKVINGIRNMKDLESSISKKNSQLSLLKVDASDLEAVKQVKDRFGVDKFCKEFEESKSKLEDYCNTLSRCLNDKRVLIETLQGCDAFYEAASEEAKIIVNAYKTFGTRLSSMKKKLNGKIRKLEERKKKEQEQKETEANKTEGTTESSESEEGTKALKGKEHEEGSDKGNKDTTDSLTTPGTTTPGTVETPDEVNVTPVTEEEVDGEKQDMVEDNTKVEDMELDSESDGEVSSGDGPLYDPTSAGQGLEGILKEKVDFDDVLDIKVLPETETGVLESVGHAKTPPLKEDLKLQGFPLMGNLPGMSALQTGMVSAFQMTKLTKSPTSSPSSEFAASPEGTPEDLILHEEEHAALKMPLKKPLIDLKPLPAHQTVQPKPATDVFQENHAHGPITAGKHSSIVPNTFPVIQNTLPTDTNLPTQRNSKMEPVGPFDKKAAMAPSLGGIAPTKPASSPLFANPLSETKAGHIKPELFSDNILTLPSPRSWSQKLSEMQHEGPHNPLAHASYPSIQPPPAAYVTHPQPGNMLPSKISPQSQDENIKILKSEALLAEAENAPSPAPSGGSTPTQDERTEVPLVRPMDVLTQLINRARGIQSTDSTPETPIVPNPLDNLLGSLLPAPGIRNELPLPGPTLNAVPPVVSPAMHTPLPAMPMVPSAYRPETPAGVFSKGFDGLLLKNDPVSDFSASLGSGTNPHFRDDLERSDIGMKRDELPMVFPNFPPFDQRNIAKGPGPNGIFLDDQVAVQHQVPLLDGTTQAVSTDSVSLSPRTQFLQSGTTVDYDGSSSSEENTVKHHRSRKRSSRSRDRSPKHRERSPKHRERSPKHKDKTGKHRDKSPKHRDRERSHRHHSPQQKDKSPKHSSKRRKHSFSKGRDSHSPGRDKHSSSRKRERSSSLDRSRSSTSEDVFYNDRRSPTPEMDSLPLGAPLSPRKVRSFELIPEAPNLDLRGSASTVPLFSPSQEVLLPSPSVVPPLTQSFAPTAPGVPLVGPPRPFMVGNDLNPSSALGDANMQQVNTSVEPMKMLGLPGPNVGDLNVASVGVFQRPQAEMTLQPPTHSHAETGETLVSLQPDRSLPPVTPPVENRVGLPPGSSDFYRDTGHQYQDRNDQQVDSTMKTFHSNTPEEGGHVNFDHKTEIPSQAGDRGLRVPYHGEGRPDDSRQGTNEVTHGPPGPPCHEGMFNPIHHHMEHRDRTQSRHDNHIERHLVPHNEFVDRKIRFPLNPSTRARPPFVERFGGQFPRQRGFEPNFNRQGDHFEPSFQHMDQFQPQQQWRGAYRKPSIQRFPGQGFPPRGPRFVPHRFDRPPFPQRPPGSFAPRGPIF